MNKENNITHIHSGAPFGEPTNGNGGGGNTTNERLARLEATVSHLATSTQLEQINTSIEKLRGEFTTLKWIFGILASSCVLVIVKLLFD